MQSTEDLLSCSFFMCCFFSVQVNIEPPLQICFIISGIREFLNYIIGCLPVKTQITNKDIFIQRLIGKQDYTYQTLEEMEEYASDENVIHCIVWRENWEKMFILHLITTVLILHNICYLSNYLMCFFVS